MEFLWHKAIILIIVFTSVYGRLRSLRKKTVSIDRPGLPSAQWFTQQLDHYNDADTRTWQQRYFVNDTFYVPGGPVFLRIEGEGPANPIWAVEGQWIEYAQTFNAICFQVEHRYYGESHPTPDASVANLQYLTSEQALADLAAIRNALAEQYGLQNAKWIAFGGSYAGSLSAWFRLKYPHLVDGAVSSSAPLFAEVNFEEYLGIVENSLAEVSGTCNSEITAAISQIDALLSQGQSGWDTITEKFRLCNSLDGTNTADVSNLYSFLCANFETIVQYNKDNREFQGSTATNVTIETICGIMDDSSVGSEMDRYAAVNSLMLDENGENCLIYSYNAAVDYLRGVTWDAPGLTSGSRQWIYQTCTEFGWYQSSDLPGQPFGPKFPLQFWIDECADVYGPKFNETVIERGVNQTNIIYGGKNAQITRVVFPNGSVDPWHNYGVLEDLNSEATAVYIQGTAHCADTYPSSSSDLPQLVDARNTIRQHISTWLA